MSFGPTHCTNSSGSVWARTSCAGVARKSRVSRTSGTFGSASMVVVPSAVVIVVVMMRFLPGGCRSVVCSFMAASTASRRW